MPPEPEPSRFSDWSSLASPPARTSPHGVPSVQIEQNDTTGNHLTTETRQERVEVGNAEGVTIVPQTELLREKQNIPARPALLNIGTRTQGNDVETHEGNVNNIPPMPIRSAGSSLHMDDVVFTSAL